MPEHLEADLPEALPPPAEAEAESPAPKTKALDAPQMVVPQRPPDDPGLPEDFDTPPAKRTGPVAADG
jgi:hypothetical protein